MGHVQKSPDTPLPTPEEIGSVPTKPDVTEKITAFEAIVDQQYSSVTFMRFGSFLSANGKVLLKNVTANEGYKVCGIPAAIGISDGTYIFGIGDVISGDNARMMDFPAKVAITQDGLFVRFPSRGDDGNLYAEFTVFGYDPNKE